MRNGHARVIESYYMLLLKPKGQNSNQRLKNIKVTKLPNNECNTKVTLRDKLPNVTTKRPVTIWIPYIEVMLPRGAAGQELRVTRGSTATGCRPLIWNNLVE